MLQITEDERQRRSPPVAPDAGAIVDNRPVKICPRSADVQQLRGTCNIQKQRVSILSHLLYSLLQRMNFLS